MPPAVATLSECFRPSMGIRMCTSASAPSSGRSPSTSWPKSTHTGNRGVHSKRSTELGVVSTAAISNPRACKSPSNDTGSHVCSRDGFFGSQRRLRDGLLGRGSGDPAQVQLLDTRRVRGAKERADVVQAAHVIEQHANRQPRDAVIGGGLRRSAIGQAFQGKDPVFDCISRMASGIADCLL